MTMFPVTVSMFTQPSSAFHALPVTSSLPIFTFTSVRVYPLSAVRGGFVGPALRYHDGGLVGGHMAQPVHHAAPHQRLAHRYAAFGLYAACRGADERAALGHAPARCRRSRWPRPPGCSATPRCGRRHSRAARWPSAGPCRPHSASRVLRSSVTLLTGTLAAFTVTVQLAVLPPTLARMMAAPAARAVTTPPSTTAASSLELYPYDAALGMLVGSIVAVRVAVLPSVAPASRHSASGWRLSGRPRLPLRCTPPSRRPQWPRSPLFRRRWPPPRPRSHWRSPGRRCTIPQPDQRPPG